MAELDYCDSRDDKQHCRCWFDGEPCCACGSDEGEVDGEDDLELPIPYALADLDAPIPFRLSQPDGRNGAQLLAQNGVDERGEPLLR